MRNSPIWLSLVLAAVLLASAVCVGVSHAESPREATSPEEAEFSLRERSVFDIAKGAYQHELTRGARAVRQDQPYAAVQAYPALRSKKPIYGLVWLILQPAVRQQQSHLAGGQRRQSRVHVLQVSERIDMQAVTGLGERDELRCCFARTMIADK